jgi:hypothetical protein
MRGASATSADEGGVGEAMEHPEMDVVVSQQLKRLWILLSDMDAAHVQRLARAANKPRTKPQGRRAA